MKSSKLSSRKLQKHLTDRKDLSFLKTYGELHPINDQEDDRKINVQIVKDDDDDDDENFLLKRGGKFRNKFARKTRGKFDESEDKDEELDKQEDDEEMSENLDDMIAPYQKLLNELNTESSLQASKRKSEEKESKKKLKKNKSKNEQEKEVASGDEDEDQNGDNDDDEESDQERAEKEASSSYAQEVLSKDGLESEEAIKNDPFHLHFEKNIDDKQVAALKSNLTTNRDKLRDLQQKLKWPGLGNFIYSPLLNEKKLNLTVNEDLKSIFIKQRMLDRLNESIKELIGVEDQEDNNEEEEESNEPLENNNTNGGENKPSEKKQPQKKKYNLDRRQLELLNVISSYVDFYDPDVDIHFDNRNKLVYTIHALNHTLKTRSRIIAHNDKMKHNKESDSGETEYRDQGLTRPKVLILVPFRKFALKIVKMMIRLLMRKNEEFVSNKKRFFDSFGPSGEEKQSGNKDRDGAQEQEGDEEDENSKKMLRDEDFSFLFAGNTEDHFKFGMSVSKKSLKLFTEFYSSDIIIASPLGLRSVISGDGEAKDYDFLSSIELLIVDNADVLMMQNWDHVSLILEHLHLQPKKNHDVDYSRVRPWLLEGHAKFYRQTLVFSRIPAPPINSIFNKYCTNFNGKCQVDLLVGKPKYQLGTICRIGFQLGQVFHRIECDSPVDLPNARFQFFIEKILPKFRDDMMSHTLIFVPSYFDFIKMRNYFKKNDISSMNISEYSDDKTVNRSRYMFYHGKVHFMLVTERFHFYKRYKLRGISHLIFYELPLYAEFYSSFANFLPDPKRFKNSAMENFSSTVLYSKFDVQKLCAVVGHQRATHMINSEKSVHMFMTE